MKGAIEVVVTDEFADWYRSLGDDDSDAVYKAVGILEAKGVNLGYPRSSAIKGSKS